MILRLSVIIALAILLVLGMCLLGRLVDGK